MVDYKLARNMWRLIGELTVDKYCIKLIFTTQMYRDARSTKPKSSNGIYNTIVIQWHGDYRQWAGGWTKGE